MKKNRYQTFATLASMCFFSHNACPASSSAWDGAYLGTKAGIANAHISSITSARPNAELAESQAATINANGHQRMNPNGFVSGIEGGYHWQFNALFLGIAADLQTFSLNSDTNSVFLDPNTPNNQFVITSYANNTWLFTARPKLGVITPQGLLYATGGLGLTFLQGDFILTDSLNARESQRINQAKAGYVFGAGIETPLSEHISLKTEYLFEHFNRTHASPMSQNTPGSDPFSNQMSLNENTLTLGLNYHFSPTPFEQLTMQDVFDKHHWKSTVGGRFFASSGSDGAPQPLLNTSDQGDRLASRLIFSQLNAMSEEVFARVDHDSGVFMKGYLGAGTITSGQLNDEDFPAVSAYSNTLSNANGNLSYGTIDLGYSFLDDSIANAGAFIGYSYYAQNINVYNCQQLAGDQVCVPSNILLRFLGISEDDRFNALRLGLASQMKLSNQLSLTSDIAYLPVVTFGGQDFHNARQLLGPEHANHGDGAMLETTLEHQLSPAWSVGLGARYWMWNIHRGAVVFDFIGVNELISEPARFNTTRYGGFLQVSYHQTPTIPLELTNEPINWSGVFIGGSIGGAWGNSTWSDPFSSTPGANDSINVAGFGDHIQSNGPTGGLNLNMNQQQGRCVYGLGLSINASDIRGENTVFSGIGGVNGQTISNYLGTLVGKLGSSFNKSLIYVDGGPAVINTHYNLNADTGALSLGKETNTLTSWGWTAGVGVEYAFNHHWSSSVEYNYIGMPNDTLTFESLAPMGAHRFVINSSTNLFKLNVNYKI